MITIAILIITLTISILAFPREGYMTPLMDKLIFSPYRVHHNREYWRLITSGFIHANIWHLIINLFVLYFFGKLSEAYFITIFGFGKGEILYATLYLTAIVVANLPSLGRYKDSPSYLALGASGATSAVVFSTILFDPWNKLIIFPIPIPIPAIIFGVLYLAYEHYMDVRGQDYVGHSAHFWGSIYGFIFPIIFEPRLLSYFFNQIF